MTRSISITVCNSPSHEKDAKVLLFNDGSITGRYAAARRIAGEPNVNCDEIDKMAMDAVYDIRWKKMYHAEVYVGLDPEFMVKAHLLLPEGEENLMYSWMLNFQYMSDDYVKILNKRTFASFSRPNSSPLYTGISVTIVPGEFFANSYASLNVDTFTTLLP